MLDAPFLTLCLGMCEHCGPLIFWSLIFISPVPQGQRYLILSPHSLLQDHGVAACCCYSFAALALAALHTEARSAVLPPLSCAAGSSCPRICDYSSTFSLLSNAWRGVREVAAAAAKLEAKLGGRGGRRRWLRRAS
ncbi:hypothetical protein PVAP13_1KG516404 [Panicum virgatum]|uniref:Uncharacterized protein n=1 Tax=Panicum virgatum TaxID=38727 RepID=A0A8T0XQQ6_PANVG|nr:hypothetical protein PVAP13_1KG516404 [Panicum virgatum]